MKFGVNDNSTENAVVKVYKYKYKKAPALKLYNDYN